MAKDDDLHWQEKYTKMGEGYQNGFARTRFNYAFPTLKGPSRLSSFVPFYKALIAIAILIMMILLGTMFTSGVPKRVSNTFSSQSTKSTNQEITKAIIMASYSEQNVTWTKDIPKDWQQVRYIADDPFAKYTTPRYQGREAMVYLTYIINHYNNLPDYMVFHHGHERAWHQPEPTPFLLRALNLTALEEEGYVSLRCTLRPSCFPKGTWLNTTLEPPGTHWTSYFMTDLLKYVYKPGDPWFDSTKGNGTGIPETFAGPCCAQFAVSRAAVQSKPLRFWQRLRAPLIRDPSEFNEAWGSNELEVKEWKLGVVYERGWHYFFGKESINCLSLKYCRNTIFQGKIHCDGTTTTWAASRNFLNINCTIDDDV